MVARQLLLLVFTVTHTTSQVMDDQVGIPLLDLPIVSNDATSETITVISNSSEMSLLVDVTTTESIKNFTELPSVDTVNSTETSPKTIIWEGKLIDSVEYTTLSPNTTENTSITDESDATPLTPSSTIPGYDLIKISYSSESEESDSIPAEQQRRNKSLEETSTSSPSTSNSSYPITSPSNSTTLAITEPGPLLVILGAADTGELILRSKEI